MKKINFFLDVAERCARESTCLRRGYGAVVADKYGTIVSTGFNGAPRGTKHCIDIGHCWRIEHNIQAGTHYEKCRAVHAEMNALLQAGKKARGANLYLTGIDMSTGKLLKDVFPCSLCARIIINAGIHCVYIKTSELINPYDPVVINDKWEKLIFGS